MHIPAYLVKNAQGKTLLETPALTLQQGGVTAIIGPSGAGKSLFLKSLFGWAYGGQGAAFGKEACLVVQDPSRGLTPGLRIDGHFQELGEQQWREKATSLLAQLGLPADALSRYPKSFSGGERQRLMAAMALMKAPKVLVCDEPAASLDPINETRLWELLVTTQQQCSLVFVTHRMDLVQRYAQQLLVLEQGRLQYHGEVQTYFAEKKQQVQITVAKSAQAQELLLEIKKLCFGYGEKTLYHDFDWQIRAGAWWWVHGLSGSGKTSLAKLMVGLAKPSSGEIQLQGRTIPWPLKSRTNADRLAIHYLFQHGALSFNPAKTVLQQMKPLFEKNQHVATETLKRLALEKICLAQYPEHYSLGEIARLSLLRALLLKPKILIADELLAPFDPSLKLLVLKELVAFREVYGATIILITHEMPIIKIADAQQMHIS